MSPTLAPNALGVSWRPELAADLLAARGSVDFVEVVAETCFAQPGVRREALSLAELWPVTPHGVKLSLGTAGGIDLDRARRLGHLARELRAPAISEHVAFTRSGSRDIGHLTPLPLTRDAVRVFARNVSAARRHLPDVPLLLENAAFTFQWPEDEMSEGDFYVEIARATGCDLLLDVANLFANARNRGLDPVGVLRSYPLDRIGLVHVAGGEDQQGFYLDTHAAPVPEAVFALVGALVAEAGPLPLLLERDACFPPFAEVAQELRRLRELQPAVATAGRREPRPVPAPVAPLDEAVLARRQDRLAALLTEPGPPSAVDTDGFDPVALARTRAVLAHKRVDEAMPLLPRLSAEGAGAIETAFSALAGTRRAARGAGIVDALRIATRAADLPSGGDAARCDRLELRSRYVADPAGEARPRRGPFVGGERLPGGGLVVAVKAPGTEASVRLFHMGGAK